MIPALRAPWLTPACVPCLAGCSAAIRVPCTNNTYQPAIDQNNAGSCKPCPAFSESPPSSITALSCRCASGFYDASGQTDEELAINGPLCLTCPTPGTKCEMVGLTLQNMTVLEGYWRLSNKSVDLRTCPDFKPEATRRDDWVSTCKPSGGQANGCANGTAGPKCTVCAREGEFYDAELSMCIPCGELDMDLALYLALAGLACIPIQMAFAWKARRSKLIRSWIAKAIRLKNRLSPRAKFKALFSLSAAAGRTAHTAAITAAAQVVIAWDEA